MGRKKKISIQRKNDVYEVLNKIINCPEAFELNNIPSEHTQTIERHVNGLHLAWFKMLDSIAPKIKCNICYEKHGLMFDCICNSGKSNYSVS